MIRPLLVCLFLLVPAALRAQDGLLATFPGLVVENVAGELPDGSVIVSLTQVRGNSASFMHRRLIPTTGSLTSLTPSFSESVEARYCYGQRLETVALKDDTLYLYCPNPRGTILALPLDGRPTREAREQPVTAADALPRNNTFLQRCRASSAYERLLSRLRDITPDLVTTDVLQVFWTRHDRALYHIIPHDPERFARRTTYVAALAPVLLPCESQSRAPNVMREETIKRMRQIAELFRQQRARHGYYARPRMRALSALLSLDRSLPRTDAWNRAWRIDADKEYFMIQSAGPDGTFAPEPDGMNSIAGDDLKLVPGTCKNDDVCVLPMDPP